MSRIITFLLAATLCCFGQAEEIKDEGALQQFDSLKSLVGTWLPKDSQTGDFLIEFELTAGGSVLVEKWMYKNAMHSMTVYHMDSDALLATHYCPQGNQPRLASLPADSPDSINFVFRDATNLDRENQSYQVELGFMLDQDSDTLTRTETYESASGREPSEMILVKIEAS